MIGVIIFAIVGAVTLVAVLFGLVAARRSRAAIVAMHVFALALIITSWSMGHTELVGRLSLAAAVILETLAWMMFRYDSPRPAMRDRGADALFYAGEAPAVDMGVAAAEYEDSLGVPGDSESSNFAVTDAKYLEPSAFAEHDSPAERGAVSHIDPAQHTDVRAAEAPVRHAESARDEICIRSYALLSRPYHVTLGVLLASVKRGGVRGARLVTAHDDDAPDFIEWGDMKVGLEVSDAPVMTETLAEALAQEDLRDDVKVAIRAHAACIALDVAYDHRTPRPLAVATALRAHAALMEFAPVIAVWWGEGMRLTAAADVGDRAAAVEQDPDAAADACISIRAFELDGDNAGLVLLDTMGLRAFGLPDAQVVAAAESEAIGRAVAGAVASRMLEEGCSLPDGHVYAADDGSSWRVAYRRSAFAPDREVLQLRQERPDA